MPVDLEYERVWHSLFFQQDPKRVQAELALLWGRSAISGRMLLFLNEIQAFPPALLLLRHVNEDGAILPLFR
jgi:hypothetical protein